MNRLLIIIVAIPIFCLGQKYELVDLDNESYFKIHVDSVDLSFNYPDGRYKIFESDTSDKASHIFHLNRSKVHGPYLKINGCSFTIGNYQSDSLWTFLTNPDDTTFKIGYWREHKCGFDINKDHLYKTPFDHHGFFRESWLFSNGNKAREALYNEEEGLIQEDFWDFDSNKVWKQITYSKSNNYSFSIVFKNDSIGSIYLVQNGLELIVDFDYNLLQDTPLLYLEINNADSSSGGFSFPIANLSVDSSKTVENYNDMFRRINLKKNEDGNIQFIFYPENQRWKSKVFRIK